MRFGFLLFPGVEELDFAGPWEMATMWRTYGKGPECLTVSETGGVVPCAKGLTVVADHSFQTCPPLDLLLVPGGFAALDEAKNGEVLAFVRTQAPSCRHVLSVCTGSFILHAAGLLNGRKATTHWKFLDTLAACDGVTVIEDRFVRDGNVWTSAGVSAGIDLALALIAEVSGPDVASTVQCNSEYYPLGKVYGSAHTAGRTSAYFRHLPAQLDAVD
jgi:transcriptional regulator GlxA family with amidase domain